jgi:hypothetical protein
MTCIGKVMNAYENLIGKSDGKNSFGRFWCCAMKTYGVVDA